jgi:hypothetical protein
MCDIFSFSSFFLSQVLPSGGSGALPVEARFEVSRPLLLLSSLLRASFEAFAVFFWHFEDVFWHFDNTFVMMFFSHWFIVVLVQISKKLGSKISMVSI